MITSIAWPNPLSIFKPRVSGVSDPRIVVAALLLLVAALYIWLG